MGNGSNKGETTKKKVLEIGEPENIKQNKAEIKIHKSTKTIEISKSYDKQFEFPQPISIKIIALLPLEDLLNVSLSCKQFYFVIKTDLFWKEMILNKLGTEHLEAKEKEKSYLESFQESRMIWDMSKSNTERLLFECNEAKYKKDYGLAAAFSRFSFITGEKNCAFVLEMSIDSSSIGGTLVAIGIGVDGW